MGSFCEAGKHATVELLVHPVGKRYTAKGKPWPSASIKNVQRIDFRHQQSEIKRADAPWNESVTWRSTKILTCCLLQYRKKKNSRKSVWNSLKTKLFDWVAYNQFPYGLTPNKLNVKTHELGKQSLYFKETTISFIWDKTILERKKSTTTTTLFSKCSIFNRSVRIFFFWRTKFPDDVS